MPLADDQNTGGGPAWLSILGGAGGVLTVIGYGIAWLWNARAAKRKTAIDEWQGIATWEKEMRYRADARANDLDDCFRRLFVFYMDARSGRFSLYDLLLLMDGVRRRQRVALQKAGLPVEDDIEMPPKPVDFFKDAEFMANTVSQSKIAAETLAGPAVAKKADGS